MTDKKLKYILVVSIIFLLPVFINAKETGKGGKNRLSKTTQGTFKATTVIDINNLNALQNINGYSDYNPDINKEGTVYPKGTGKNAIYTAGFLWGGYPNGDTSQVYVGGSAYISGLAPGPILSNGEPADPNDPRWSIYRVRPDVYPGGPDVDLSSDAASESYWNPAAPTSADQARQRYEDDWNNWPAAGTSDDLGAPFTDVNNDGIYEPDVDIPGVPGADQTVFYVANDMDNSLTTNLYGAPPLGLEIHVTMWAYAQAGALGNMYFKKWELINKGKQKYTIDSMYVSYWSDVDLGDAGDDLVGSDTTLSMSYCYNGGPTDAVYNPLPPPAVGFDFFQGPIVSGSASDSAIFKGKVIHGMKNLPMTASYFFINSDANFGDPPEGEPTGSTQFYHFFNGQYGLSGLPFVDNNGNTTKFAFPGDPVKGTGWLDGVANAPADRRQGMASGPFNMAPGDTQQVVVAVIVAGAVPGVDYHQAITLLKTYDKTAQNAYDNFFNLPSAPSAPQVTATDLSNKVVLDWGENPDAVKATENKVIQDRIDGGNYNFEGYNVYQLPYFGASVDQGKKIATYDVINEITSIPYTDPVTRTVEPSISIQNGTDSGIKRYIVDSIDVFNGNKPLVNGLNYFYAVTAYNYNPIGVPQSLENPIAIITVTPHSPDPGVTDVNPGDLSATEVQHEGLANASANVTLVNSSQINGHQYQVTFHNEMFSLGESGEWTDVTEAGKKLAKAKDLTGSSLSSVGEWSEQAGFVTLHYLVDVESPNGDWCDAIQLQLPSGLIIDSAYAPIGSYTGDEIQVSLDRSTNTIFYGDPSLITSDTTTRDGFGEFAGGEDIKILAHSVALPIIANYTMYDDNFGATYVDSANGYPFGRLVDVMGIDTLKTIANKLVVQGQWNVTDKTTGNVVLKNQTILKGVDVYAPQDYFATTGIMGPGGSSGSPTGDVGAGANPTFDGIRVAIDGSFQAPTTFQSLELNGKSLKINASSGDYVMSDFSLSFSGFGDGAFAWNTIGSYTPDGVGYGTHSVNELQQDYEIRWTGVRKTTVTNGDTVVSTGSGGQMATLFGASSYSLADDPANPNPGTDAPFLIRIPFEVWNVDKNEQVNVLVWHRLGNVTDNPFNEWNYFDRMYVWIVNTKYDPSAPISSTAQVVADSATWNWVFFTSDYTQGDVIKVTYANPLQVGQDTYTFTVPKQTYSEAVAKEDVSKINVFPNPYYGVNSQELSKYTRYVTFNHLPAQTPATIRIFNLAGFQVRSIEHTSQSQFERWDLNNESGLPVSSGVYIAYIDMPKLGQTKILKFAIIQEQQMPDRF